MQKDETQEHTTNWRSDHRRHRSGLRIVGSRRAAKPAAGPRATHIAYMSKVDGQADIYSMTTEGFAVTNLTHDKTIGLRADSEPAWSPDGQWVAFQRTGIKAPGTRLFVVRSDGWGLHALVPSSALAASEMHPNWSPDGRTIVFSSNRTGHFELYMVKVDPGITTQRTVSVATQLTFTKLGRRQPRARVGARWQVDRVRAPRVELVRRDPLVPDRFDLHAPAHVEHDASDLSDHGSGIGNSDCQPAWSGDSSQIAFESNRTGTEDIFVVDQKGNGLRRITPLGSNEFHPSWASLGRQIVFVSDRTEATEIYTLTVPVLGSRTPMPAMKQLTFDKAPKANPAMERITFMGLN